MANISQTKEMLEKSASALKKMKNKVEQEKEKRASIEKRAERREKAFNKLFKMAKNEQIDFEDLPEKLEKMASLDEEKFEVEMKVLEKVASQSFLDYGGVGEKNDSDFGDPISNFVMKNAGF